MNPGLVRRMAMTSSAIGTESSRSSRAVYLQQDIDDRISTRDGTLRTATHCNATHVLMRYQSHVRYQQFER